MPQTQVVENELEGQRVGLGQGGFEAFSFPRRDSQFEHLWTDVNTTDGDAESDCLFEAAGAFHDSVNS